MCSCWAGCLRGQHVLCAITTERSSSVVPARRTRPDVGASQAGSDVLTRHSPKVGWEVKGDQKIVVWQGHAPEPTVRTTVPQKAYTSLGSRASASEVLCFPNRGWLKTLLQGALTQPVAKSCGLIAGQLLEGGMPAHVCVDTDTRVRRHTCARLCTLHHLAQCTLTFSAKIKLPSLRDLCRSWPIFFTHQGFGSDKGATSPFRSFILSPLSIMRF